MFKISATYTLAALIWFLIMSNLIKGLLGKRINAKTGKLTESISDIQEFLLENIQQIKLIKILKIIPKINITKKLKIMEILF